MKKMIIPLAFFLFLVPAVQSFSQSNDMIDLVLEEDPATYGNTVYLALTGAGYVSESATPAEALDVLKQQGWKLKTRSPDDPLRLGDYAQVLLQAFDIKGGLFYSMFKSPRYASRELKYLGFVKGSSASSRRLSGEDAVKILGKLMRWKEEM